MTAYRIRDWNRHFENNRSRQIEDLRWVAIPNRHDGEGYSLVMRHDRAAEIFAAWVLIVQVASKCNPRGTLTRDNRTPLTAEALALKTRAPVEWFTLAINYLSSAEVRWLEPFETENITPETSPGRHPGVTQASPGRHPGVTQASPGRQSGAIEGKEGRKERREGGKGVTPQFSETAGELGIGKGSPQPEPTETMKNAAAVLAYLNKTTGKQYDSVPSILDVIKNRLREGATVEDCQFAIRHCYAEWHQDARMASYVRPSTIFGDKFHEYKENGRRKFAKRNSAATPKTFKSEIERLEHEFVTIRDKVEAARTESAWTGNSFREQRAKLAKAFLVEGEKQLEAAQQALEAARKGGAQGDPKSCHLLRIP